MKNPQRSFIVSVLLIMIALLVIGGGVYIYKNKKTQAPLEANSETQQSNQNQSPEINGWQAYSSSKYGFSIQYPQGTKISDSDISGGRKVLFSTSEGTLMVEVVNQAWHNGALTSPANCNDFDSHAKVSEVNINGIHFVRGDVSIDFSGMNSASSATEYCVMHNGTAYKVIAWIMYGHGEPVDVNQNSTLNQMVASFKFVQ